MSNTITMACPGCGKEITVSAKFAGQKLHCAGCGREMYVPRPGEAPVPAPAPADEAAVSHEEDASPAAPAAAPVARAADADRKKLTVARDRIVNGTAVRCPQCGATMRDGEPVCRQCQFNIETGQNMAELAEQQERRRRNLRRAVQWVVALALVFFAAVAVLGFIKTRRASVEKAIEAARAAEPSVDELRRRFRAELDEKEPMYEVGARVKLILRNGFVVSGSLQGISAKGILLEFDDQQRKTVAFADLRDPAQARRFDMTARDREIEVRLAAYRAARDAEYQGLREKALPGKFW